MTIIIFMLKVFCTIVGFVILLGLTFSSVDVMLWLFFDYSLRDIACAIRQYYKDDEVEINFETVQK